MFMRHDVPQFIDIEDKIIGPFSFKQSIYLAGSIGVGFIIFSLLSRLPFEMPFMIKMIIAAPPVIFGALLAFIKINKRDSIFYFEAFFKYSLNPKKFVWKKQDKKAEVRGRKHQEETEQLMNVNPQYVPKVTKSKIKDLALSLDMELDEKLNKLL